MSLSPNFNPHVVHATAKVAKPAYPVQQQLRVGWSLWLAYRLLLLPALLTWFWSQMPWQQTATLDWLSGVMWQGLLLLPAFLLTPWMYKARSPYVLLVSTLVMMVYLGISGMSLFARLFDGNAMLISMYAVDFVLLLVINAVIFNLLKRLPKMNS